MTDTGQEARYPPTAGHDQLSGKGDYVNLGASRALAFASRLRFAPGKHRVERCRVTAVKRAIRDNLQESGPAIGPFCRRTRELSEIIVY